jgi:SAM-dependent methyltransferase
MLWVPSGNTVNAAYYGQTSTGRDDYWSKMAAPRFRVATLLKLLDEEPAASVVDLGCGGGNLLGEIRTRRPDVRLAGVDLSPAQIDANRARLPEVGWYAADLAVPSAASELPAHTFDAVLASEIVEHVPDAGVFLRNALRLAAPGGRLLLSTQSGPVRETERRVGHVRHFTVAQMHGALAEAGWRPVRVWNAGFPFHDLSKWYANLDPDTSMLRFGERSYGWKEDLVCLALRLAFELNSSRRGAQLFAVARRAQH